MPEFGGLKLSQDPATCATYKDLHHVALGEGKIEILVEKPGVVCGGGNSAFQALNLVVQFGASRIALVGFDMHTADGLHWHGPHGHKLNNPSDRNFIDWRRNFNSIAGQLAALGVEVVNTSLDSALTAYPKIPLDEIMDKWSPVSERADQDCSGNAGEQRGSGMHGGALA